MKRLAESLRGEKGIIARLRDAVARMVEYFKNRGDKVGVRRMKAADKLLAEFEGALKEGVAPEQVKPEGIERSVRESRSEKTELTAEERELRDNLVKRMHKGGLDVVTDSEEMQRVIDTENERTRMMGAGSVRELRVYHGSGADFDAFDHSHMGEGEGAQAYGWGTYVTEVEGIGKTYAEQNATTHNDALRALQHDVDAISDQLNRHRDDLKYDEEQLKRANEWRAEAELDYDYHNDKFFQKHHIALTLFIIIQIIGKTKSWKNIHFFRTNETYSTCQHVAIVTSKHQRFFSGISCLSAYAK